MCPPLVLSAIAWRKGYNWKVSLHHGKLFQMVSFRLNELGFYKHSVISKTSQKLPIYFLEEKTTDSGSSKLLLSFDQAKVGQSHYPTIHRYLFYCDFFMLFQLLFLLFLFLLLLLPFQRFPTMFSIFLTGFCLFFLLK